MGSVVFLFEDEKSCVLLTFIFVTPTFLSQGNNTACLSKLSPTLSFNVSGLAPSAVRTGIEPELESLYLPFPAFP